MVQLLIYYGNELNFIAILIEALLTGTGCQEH